MARKYFYDTGEEKIGPVTGNDLVRLRAEGEIDDQTWVRRADSSTWRHLGGINLKQEEEEEANPSLFKILMRSLLQSQSCWAAGLILAAIIAAVCIILYYAWPVVLVLLLMLLVASLIHSGSRS